MAEAISLNDDNKKTSNYLILSLKTEFALGGSIALLETRRTLSGDGDETRNITFHIAKYNAKRAKIKADRIAFLAEQTKIKPPKKSKLDKAINLSKKLDNMIASSTTTKAILDTTTRLLKLYNSTRM